ncbi:glycoside hydrolase family 3 C-terminal domain-containing protein [Nocardia sp. CDC186]|uniref:Glycoside hydrolase family 3 C-terminal domain-containing protein n=1 Tax=Nocardia implantans TaxID=3108168 RepID=A0ABU6ASS5_9NOCA|nr:MULTISPECIES: glycoside hydrolase family 3 C-terminal domain-containing protein [unclassified Nocardia]MBF6191841.1 glycoside hydrolase family 3 C-terminal domain-containing protein [Nocardia beijingensis]MEA3527848.1 glycoside hydrolase family 3 C-terminal domain-containing protein [Nocardia sp. CDC192]MEB3510401.1 glycoside hydrolase family 3 C-terminal domain-containing protein [Nocardia sp. CDC186]
MTSTPDLTDLAPQQRAALGSGADFWTTKAIGSVTAVTMTDGPHGVRRQAGATDHLGSAESLPATCFPPAVGLAQSWDVDLVRRVGEALGREARALGVDVLLGPGVNIKRDPRGGRNFEYYSEDPSLTGLLGAAWVTGVQSTGVGASLKHFAANNAEHDRMRSSSDVDTRPLREIYLRAFAHIVRTARPWTVMCSYNRINGVHAAQNRWLLTDVLRGEWGFDGAVISDWGAVADRPASVTAGLDLEMPGGSGISDAQVLAAMAAGTLDPADVDRAARNVATLAAKVVAGRELGRAVDTTDEHHRLARAVAARCVVLLRNDRGLLPLTPGRSLAVIGEFAAEPRYQGGGSSHVNPTRLDVPLEEIRALAGAAPVSYSRGFATADTGVGADALRAEAVAAARHADVAVVFLGSAAAQESEGFDRQHIELPAEQVELLAAVVRAQPETVVVLAHGGVVRLAPVAALAPAILDGGLLGQAGGGALADVLFGVVNPSGRLAETVPVRLQDTPAYLGFPGENSHVRYGEGLYVGYRWYDSRDMDVTYPFGHGLSYTTFEYSDLALAAEPAGIAVRVRVTNTGSRVGREVVQVYTALPGSAVSRPVRELKAVAVTAELEPGASEEVSLLLRRDDLAYWETRVDRWIVEGGAYQVWAGASSRDLRIGGQVQLAGDDLRIPITAESTLGEAMADPAAAAALAEVFGGMSESMGDATALGVDMMRMIASIPLNRLTGFGVDPEKLDALLARGDD